MQVASGSRLGRAPTLADALAPGRGLARDAALVVGFAALVAALAQLAVRLPFTPVPITGQTLGVLLAGGALGSRRGAASLGLYALAGALGVPVFAPDLGDGVTWHAGVPWLGSSGAVWGLPSGGYVVGFIGAAWVVGRLSERGWDRSWRALLALLAGNAALYVPGLLWLGYWGVENGWTSGGSVVADTLEWGLWPFVAGDLAKLYVAAVALPLAWWLLGERGGGSRERGDVGAGGG